MQPSGDEEWQQFPPDLTYQEEFARCGYQPRTLRLIEWVGENGERRDIIFAGCKDGSLWVVEYDSNDKLASQRLLPGSSESGLGTTEVGIRAICPTWDDSLLVLGRSNGVLEIVAWSKERANTPPVILKRHSVEYWNESLGKQRSGLRTVSGLDENWIFISFGGTCGTYLVDITRPAVGGDPIAALKERIQGLQPLLSKEDDHPVHEIRFACKVGPWKFSGDDESAESKPSSERWLLISERATFYTWDGSGEPGSPFIVTRFDDPWHIGERPSFINDFSRWGEAQSSDSHFRGVFLATDRGVFLLTTVEEEEGIVGLTRPQRLSLPGLGLVCTALTYVEVPEFQGEAFEGPERTLRYLWVVDSKGACHLFCDSNTPSPSPSIHREDFPNFRSSGFTNLGSQALLAHSWKIKVDQEEARYRFFLAYARRDDHIAVGCYLTMGELTVNSGPYDIQREARYLLSLGCPDCITQFIQRHDLPGIFQEPSVERRHPSSEVIAEFIEFLAEDPLTREVLEEFLCNPSARTSSNLLLNLESMDCPKCKENKFISLDEKKSREWNACVALDLWTLTLLGTVHRSLNTKETERFCLGILRWLEDSRDRFREQALQDWYEPEREAVLARYEDCLRMVRKWGLYGEANARRPSLVRPIEILEAQGLESQQLDLLTYEALLFHRSVDQLTVDRWNEMAGNSAWSLATHEVNSGEGCELLVAVSWRWTGVEILRLTNSDGGELQLEECGVIECNEENSDDGFSPLAESKAKRLDQYLNPQQRVVRKKYGHSRILLLAKKGGRDFLVMSAVQERGQGLLEKIFIYKLNAGGAGRPIANLIDFHRLPAGESAYSILDLGEGNILVGLRGSGGRPVLWLMTLDGTLHFKEVQRIEITSDQLGVSASKLNRVWCMARAWSRDDSGGDSGEAPCEEYDVIIGTDNGEVWRLVWPREGPFSQEHFFPEGEAAKDSRYRVEPVTRLASPVHAVAYRKEGILCENAREESFEESQGTEDGEGEVPEESQGSEGGIEDSAGAVQESQEDTVCRVFVGGADGSIVGLQRVMDEREGSFSFTPVWATWEQGGPINELQFITTPDGFHQPSPEGYPEPDVFVAAVTRSGFCTLFDDRLVTPPAPQDQEPHRIPFPGCRHGRFFLGRAIGSAQGPKALAAQFLPIPLTQVQLPGSQIRRSCPCVSVDHCGCTEGRPDAFGRLALILSATDRGTLHVQGLHLPDLTQARRNAYKKLRQRWWEVCKNSEGLVQLRLGEAAFGATSTVSLLLTRWLLEAKWSDETIDPLEGLALEGEDLPISRDFPRRWQLPRHLRPLLDLRRAWQELEQVEDVNQGDLLLKRIGGHLEFTLRSSRRLRDLHLYQEVCEVILRRANYALIQAVSEEDQRIHQRTQELYFQIYGAIERSLEYWLGRPRREESRARMTVAKNLVDGFTALAVLRGVAMERRREQQPESERRFLARVWEKRIEGFQQLVFKRDPLVSLESLRATNLSLMRMCRKLVCVDADSAGTGRTRLNGEWIPRPSPERIGEIEFAWKESYSQEIQWAEFSSFVKELVYAAVRASRSPGMLSDALTHEYSRAFALTICVCPSAAIRIVNRMTEARLIVDLQSPGDMARKVERQLKFLSSLGLPVPSKVLKLFDLAIRGPWESPRDWSSSRDLRYPLARLIRGKKRKRLGIEATAAIEKKLARGTYHLRQGVQNIEDLRCIACLHFILEWLDELVEALSSDVRKIHEALERAEEVNVVLEVLKSFSETPVGSARRMGLYTQSFDFWRDALLKPNSPSRCFGDLLEHPGPIRPELLEHVRRWKQWAEQEQQELKYRFNNLKIFQPEYSLFGDVLYRFSREAGRFREGATVQKAVVVGILGHHLLEDLDEHVLELEEIAQSLNPSLVERYRESGRQYPAGKKGAPTDDAIASYLIRRAHRAESIPENLRKLYGILDREEQMDHGEKEVKLAELLDPYRASKDEDMEWAVEETEEAKEDTVDPLEEMYLDLVLSELSQNHAKYYSGKEDRLPIVRLGEGSIQLSFPFASGFNSHHYRRLSQLMDKDAQQPLTPYDDQNATSSGTGIYLAKLAASVVGWTMHLCWDPGACASASQDLMFQVVLKRETPLSE